MKPFKLQLKLIWLQGSHYVIDYFFFISGSVGRGTETPGSDIDVLIIGSISFTDAVKALYSAQAIVKREINPKVYTKSEWKKLMKERSSFAKEILHAPKLFIIGTINDIE